MKVAINACFGGFSLSDEAFVKLVGMPIDVFYRKELGDKEYEDYVARFSGKFHDNMHRLPDGIERHDPRLIAVIEEMGSDHRTGASGDCAYLRVVEIPDGVDYEIEEYDGNEHVAEKHRTWP